MTGAALPIRYASSVAALALLTTFVAPALRAQDPPAAPQESLDVQVVPGDRWVVNEASEVSTTVTSHFEDGIEIDSARLALPPELRCGSRSTELMVRLNPAVALAQGGAQSLRFPLEAAEGLCFSGGLFKPARSRTVMEVFYYHPITPGVHTQQVTIAWSAPVYFVMAGAALGVLGCYALLLLAVRTGRLPASKSTGSVATELAFGGLSVVITVLLGRLLAPDEQPAAIRPFVTESFGHGFVLGLLYQTVAASLLRWLTAGRGKNDAPKPADAPAETHVLDGSKT